MTEGGRSGLAERLRRIEAVADSTLSQLGSDELLSELLDRLCQLLHADIGAILLLDQHARQLVATVVKGLDEEVRLGFRLGVGRGFAGRVAQERRPVIIEELQPSEVVSQVMRDRGVRSVIGVPILQEGQLLGVLHVGSLRRRTFDDDDVTVMQLAAVRAAAAVRGRLSQQDRAAALALQRSLLPTQLPTVNGVELSARYVPGHDVGVGGDWFDVFHLPDSRLGIVVGDVSGSGLAAAVVMGRVRSALRAYALECADPADALMRLDHKVDHFEAGSLTTVLYAIVNPGRDRVTVSTAGHPPPVLVAPGEPAQLVPLPADLPLGTNTRPARRNTELPLPAGAVLVAYTDGLIERRNRPITAGLAELLAAVRPGSAEEVCSGIMSALDTERVTDDIAVLTLHRTGA